MPKFLSALKTSLFGTRTTDESSRVLFTEEDGSGEQAIYTNDSLRYNPSTGALSSTSFHGDFVLTDVSTDPAHEGRVYKIVVDAGVLTISEIV